MFINLFYFSNSFKKYITVDDIIENARELYGRFQESITVDKHDDNDNKRRKKKNKKSKNKQNKNKRKKNGKRNDDELEEIDYSKVSKKLEKCELVCMGGKHSFTVFYATLPQFFMLIQLNDDYWHTL